MKRNSIDLEDVLPSSLTDLPFARHHAQRRPLQHFLEGQGTSPGGFRWQAASTEFPIKSRADTKVQP